MATLEKEFFNMRHCKKDLLYQLRNEMLEYLGDFFTSLLSFGMLAGLLLGLYSMRPFKLLLFAGILSGAVPIAYFIGPICYGIYVGVRIAGNRYYIIEDTYCGYAVVEMRSPGNFHIGHSSRGGSRPVYRRDEFYFDAYGRCILKGNFTWSRYYREKSTCLSRDTHVGDKFYLLVCETGRQKKKTIACIYPQKYFVWQGETV